MDYKIEFPDGKIEQGKLMYGQMKKFPLGIGKDDLPLKAKATLNPARSFDLGRGKGAQTMTTELSGGVVGIILDGRGRPFDLPTDAKTRVCQAQGVDDRTRHLPQRGA